MTSSLGISFKVAPDMADSFRQGQSIKDEASNHQIPLPVNDDPFSCSSDQEYQQQVEQEEDWDEVLPLPKPIDDESDHEEQSITQQQEDEEGDNDSDDDVSLSPPPCLPCVIVDLKKLCGYVPSNKEEAKELQNQVHAALMRDDDDDDDENDNVVEGEQLSRHFERRVGELLETGVANHSDTLEVESTDNNSLAIVQYPVFYCRSDGNVVVTARQWKILLKPHAIEVVDRLLKHLRKCNRVYSWKMDMHKQLRYMVKMQQEELHAKNRERELQEWRTERRRVQLDKLYQVRETFDHKLETAREKLESLEEERELWVRQELRRLGMGGVEGLDFDPSTIYAFDETNTSTAQSLTNGHEKSDHEDDGYVQSQDEESSSEDDLSLDGNDDDTTSGFAAQATATSGLPLRSTSRKNRTRRLAKRRQQAMENQAEAAQRAAKIEQARAEEDAIRQSCSLTSKVQMAQAVVQSLEQRMKQVDDLLESLQEEEWADEEELGENDASNVVENNDDKEEELTLLDQILAMILGALPQGERSTEEHYKYVRDEHQSIKKEWKEYFGKLPVSLASSADHDSNVSNTVQEQSQEDALERKMQEMGIEPTSTTAKAQTTQSEPMSVDAMRSSLGIVDVEGDWDDVNNLDEFLSTTDVEPPKGVDTGASKESAVDAKPKTSTKVGLRPGGKVKK